MHARSLGSMDGWKGDLSYEDMSYAVADIRLKDLTKMLGKVDAAGKYFLSESVLSPSTPLQPDA